jgi:hypothetical protein
MSYEEFIQIILTLEKRGAKSYIALINNSNRNLH